MEFNFGIFIMFLILVACLAVSSYVGFLVFRLCKDNQRQSNLMLKALVKSMQDMRSFDTKINLVQETGMQSLTFQKKAFDHQRILMLSMNQQLKSIHTMLGNGSEKTIGNGANTLTGKVSLTRAAANNTFQSQSPKTANTRVGATESVVRLEDLFAKKISKRPFANSELEGAVTMPIEQNAPQFRRIVNG